MGLGAAAYARLWAGAVADVEAPVAGSPATDDSDQPAAESRRRPLRGRRRLWAWPRRRGAPAGRARLVETFLGCCGNAAAARRQGRARGRPSDWRRLLPRRSHSARERSPQGRPFRRAPRRRGHSGRRRQRSCLRHEVGHRLLRLLGDGAARNGSLHVGHCPCQQPRVRGCAQAQRRLPRQRAPQDAGVVLGRLAGAQRTQAARHEVRQKHQTAEVRLRCHHLTEAEPLGGDQRVLRWRLPMLPPGLAQDVEETSTGAVPDRMPHGVELANSEHQTSSHP